MGTTADKLNKVLETKEAIRTAINSKGGTLTETDTFASYATAIDNIQSGGKEEETKSITITENGTTTVLPTSGKVLSKVDIVANVPQTAESGTVKNLLDAIKTCYYLFNNYKGTSVDGLISYNDTSNVISMESMFNNCSNLTTIPQLNTSSCTHMNSMFYFCSSLQTLPQLNTSSCIYMNSMFYYCSSLYIIPQLNTSSCTNMSRMFYQCKSLSTIDLTHLSSSLGEFASNCYRLKKLIIRNMNTIPSLSSSSFTNCYHFYGTTDNIYNPEGLKDGRIYVPDDKVEALKTATNWSVFADIIVPLSTLVEE